MNAPLAHPIWCDPDQCTAGQAQSYHRSKRYEINGPEPIDTLVELSLWAPADEPVGETPPVLQMRMSRRDVTSIEVYEIEPPHLAQFAAALSELAGIVAREVTS